MGAGIARLAAGAGKALQRVRVPIKKAVGPGGVKTFRNVLGKRGSLRRNVVGFAAGEKAVRTAVDTIKPKPKEPIQESYRTAVGVGAATFVGAKGLTKLSQTQKARKAEQMRKSGLAYGHGTQPAFSWSRDYRGRKGVTPGNVGSRMVKKYTPITVDEEVLNERIGGLFRGIGRKLGVAKPKGGLVGRRALKPKPARAGSRGRNPMEPGKRGEVVRGLRDAPTGKPLVKTPARKAAERIGGKARDAVKGGVKWARTPSKYNPDVVKAAKGAVRGARERLGKVGSKVGGAFSGRGGDRITVRAKLIDKSKVINKGSGMGKYALPAAAAAGGYVLAKRSDKDNDKR